jgi:hypothetical protein
MQKNGYICIDTGVTTRLLSSLDIGCSSWMYPPLNLHVFSNTSLLKLMLKNNLTILYFNIYWNLSINNRWQIIRMYLSVIKRACLNINKVLNKVNQGSVANIGLILAKNDK